VKASLAAALAVALLPGSGFASDGAQILEHAPAAPDPKAHYLFYLHGRIIEVQGPEAVSQDFGRYEYDPILEAFAERGFTVIAEVRKDGAGREFAVATARQVRALLDAGVPPRSITVVGFSKGGYLALGVSAIVASEDVGYAILAGCGSDPAWLARLGPRIRGRFLSLLDRSDRLSPSCEPLFAAAELVSDTSEHVFDTGLDHGLFYRPRTDWIGRVADWARPDGPRPGPGGG
jgi:pimeloyl-ACP methyl ester carboxylesterase